MVQMTAVKTIFACAIASCLVNCALAGQLSTLLGSPLRCPFILCHAACAHAHVSNVTYTPDHNFKLLIQYVWRLQPTLQQAVDSLTDAP